MNRTIILCSEFTFVGGGCLFLSEGADQTIEIFLVYWIVPIETFP